MFDLSKFSEYKENNCLEVKKAKGGLPRSLWDTYSSFANSYGGVIILGVAENDDGSFRTTGLENPEKLQKDFWDTINNRTKVSVNLLTERDVELHIQDGNVIMVVHVPMASRDVKPVYLNDDMFNNTFRRDWEGDYHCSEREVRAMLRDQTEATSDMKVLDDFEIEDLNQETINSYRNLHKTQKSGHVWTLLDDAEFLKNIGAAAVSKSDRKLHPTAAGLLMFGNEYDIVREFPEYFLDYREILDASIRWVDRLQSSSGEWSGNLFDFYFRVYNKLIKDVKVPFKIEGGERVDDTPVRKAIREALANCLINTDYFMPRGIVIKKEPDAIILENPGYIRVGIEQMRKGGESDPRNKSLMKMFNLVNIGERAGSGVPDIFRVWDDAQLEEPIIEERFGEAARTTLKLLFIQKKATEKSDRKKATEKSDRKKATEKTLQNYELILSSMQPDAEYKIDEVSEWLDLGRTRTRELLKALVAAGKVGETGTTKSKRYFKAK